MDGGLADGTITGVVWEGWTEKVGSQVTRKYDMYSG